jgi:NAD(P)-dependent dehydrogenase (short-subunit alcohol dehydrogenase family)
VRSAIGGNPREEEADIADPVVSFEGRVVIVTGAGNGLGRAHALELARRGASVLVNDLGGSPTGEGASPLDAERVVDEIQAAGGRAMPSFDSVATREGGLAICERAMEAFGRIDAVVNNAGILRNADFGAMTEDELMGVVGTHLLGSFYVSQPAYRIMCDQGYGRFVHTSSGSGLFGLRGQANYCASKAGIVGLSNAIALEGEKHGVHSNVVAPTAATRIAAGMRPGDITEDDLEHAARDNPDGIAFPAGPEFVTPLVVYLASDRCRETQQIYSATHGRFARAFTGVTRGWYGPFDRPATAEEIIEHLEEIRDGEAHYEPRTVIDEGGQVRRWYRRPANE